jgi:hypothetical protein
MRLGAGPADVIRTAVIYRDQFFTSSTASGLPLAPSCAPPGAGIKVMPCGCCATLTPLAVVVLTRHTGDLHYSCADLARAAIREFKAFTAP